MNALSSSLSLSRFLFNLASLLCTRLLQTWEGVRLGQKRLCTSVPRCLGRAGAFYEDPQTSSAISFWSLILAHCSSGVSCGFEASTKVQVEIGDKRTTNGQLARSPRPKLPAKHVAQLTLLPSVGRDRSRWSAAIAFAESRRNGEGGKVSSLQSPGQLIPAKVHTHGKSKRSHTGKRGMPARGASIC